MAWTIYYSDGSTYSDQDGPPESAPGRDVQVIVQTHTDVGAITVTGRDYYIWRDGRWWSVDIFGLYDFLLDVGLVKFGRYVRRDEYQAVMRKALKELDAVKNGYLPGERKA